MHFEKKRQYPSNHYSPDPPEVQGLKTISIGYSLGARFHHQVLPRLLSGAADGPRRPRRDGHLRAAAARPGRERDGRAVEGGCLSSGPLGSISEVQVIRYFILLHRARSWLYRRRSLKVNTNFSAFFEIYMI